MSTYKHLLVGLDLSEESTTVLKKAQALAQLFNAKLSAAHVVEPIAYAYGGDVPIDLSDAQDVIEKQANERLAALLKSAGVMSQGIVSLGSTATELHRLAEENAADLIVVGSHGRHGFALLLGSTATGVMHGASCDVLAVRV